MNKMNKNRIMITKIMKIKINKLINKLIKIKKVKIKINKLI